MPVHNHPAASRRLCSPPRADGFLRFNLLSSGIQDSEPVPGEKGMPTAKNFRFQSGRVNCGTLVDAGSIPAESPLTGFLLQDVTGTCTKGVKLANITGAEIRNLRVSGYGGALLSTTNVQGSGLEQFAR